MQFPERTDKVLHNPNFDCTYSIYSILLVCRNVVELPKINNKKKNALGIRMQTDVRCRASDTGDRMKAFIPCFLVIVKGRKVA